MASLLNLTRRGITNGFGKSLRSEGKCPKILLQNCFYVPADDDNNHTYFYPIKIPPYIGPKLHNALFTI